MEIDKLKQLEKEIAKQPTFKLIDKFGTKISEALNPQPKEQPKSLKQKQLEGTA